MRNSFFKHTLILFICFPASSFAQLDSYSYKRKLDKVTKEDFYSIRLSPGITAHSKSNLNDLRIFQLTETDTTEVPYLLDWMGDKTEATAVNFELINDVTHLKCCSYVTLKMNKSKVLNEISLDVQENNFDKILTLEGSNDTKEWFTIKQHLRITGFDNSGISFRSTSIHFPSAEYGYFRIKFDDDSSPRITITGASATENKTQNGMYDELSVRKNVQTENKKEKTSELIIDLENNYMLSYITLKSDDKNDFYRNINIYASTGTFHTPKGDEEAWQMVNSGVIVSNEENIFQLGNTQTKKLKVEIINYDNQPIRLNGIKVFSEEVMLTSKLPQSENLYLVYGKENASAPVYDLVHFRDKIPASLTAVSYGKEELKAATTLTASGEPLISNKLWLWVAMAGLILLIGYFALSMMKKEKG